MAGRAGDAGEGGRREEGTWLRPLRSALLRAPTLRGSALRPQPGHAPPELLGTQSSRRPPEPPKSRPRRMGAPGSTPLLLLLMLGKPGPCPPPQPRSAGACHLAPSPAAFPMFWSPLHPTSSSGAPPDRRDTQILGSLRLKAGTPLCLPFCSGPAWVPAVRGQCLPVFIIAPRWPEAQGPALPMIFEVSLP